MEKAGVADDDDNDEWEPAEPVTSPRDSDSEYWGFSGKEPVQIGSLVPLCAGGGGVLTQHQSSDREQMVKATLVTGHQTDQRTATNCIFYSRFTVNDILQYYFRTE
jgi:hypothetical protein